MFFTSNYGDTTDSTCNDQSNGHHNIDPEATCTAVRGVVNMYAEGKGQGDVPSIGLKLVGANWLRTVG